MLSGFCCCSLVFPYQTQESLLNPTLDIQKIESVYIDCLTLSLLNSLLNSFLFSCLSKSTSFRLISNAIFYRIEASHIAVCVMHPRALYLMHSPAPGEANYGLPFSLSASIFQLNKSSLSWDLNMTWKIVTLKTM